MMTAVPQINQNLESVTTLPEISIDYSLSGDIAVTPHSLDVPFKVRNKHQQTSHTDPEHDPIPADHETPGVQSNY